MKRRSVFQFLVTSFLVAVLTASCGLFGTTNTPQSTTGTQSPVASTEVVKIGAILPLTGPTGFLGEGQQFGMNLAISDLKTNKRKVEFIFEDSKGKPDIAVSAAKKLLDIDNVNIQIVSTTGVALATLPVYKQSGKDNLVFVMSVLPGITKNYPFAYRIYPTADEETDLVATYAKKQNYKRIGALNVAGQAGEVAIKLLNEKVKSFGGEIIAIENFKPGEKDFRVALQKFKSLNLDGIFIYPFATDYPTISKQYDELGLEIPVLGSLNLAFSNLDKQLTTNFKKNVVFPAPRYFFSKDDPAIKAFDEKTRASGKESSFDIAYAYDMTNILVKAIDNSSSLSAKSISEAIQKQMPYQGVSGNIRLNDDRDTRSDMRLVQYTSNGVKVLD